MPDFSFLELVFVYLFFGLVVAFFGFAAMAILRTGDYEDHQSSIQWASAIAGAAMLCMALALIFAG